MVVFNPAAHLEVSSESLEARYRVASQTLQRSDMRRCLTTMFLFFVQGLRGPVGSPGTPGQAGMSVCTQTFLICAGFSFNRNCKWWDGLKAPEHPPSPLSHQICELCYKFVWSNFFATTGSRLLLNYLIRVCACTSTCKCARAWLRVCVRVQLRVNRGTGIGLSGSINGPPPPIVNFWIRPYERPLVLDK